MNNKIILYGNPIPLKRHRHTKKGLVYNAQKSEMIKNSFIISAQYSGPILYGPVKIKTIFFMPIPKSLSQKKQTELQGKYHKSKPDIDNLEKKLYDEIVLSGNIIKDDSQISISETSKIYSANPRTEITIIDL